MNKMVRFGGLIVACFLISITFQNCLDDDSEADVVDNLVGGYIRVNTEKLCLSEPNYKGDDVYAYRLDSSLNEPSLEIGGHPFSGNGDFTVDLITRVDDIENGYYALNHSVNRYAGVIYSPSGTGNDEYISLPTQAGSVQLEELAYESDGKTVKTAKVSFTNVKLAYMGDTICVTGLIKLNVE